jgi:deferrochelatase/peroxidase EfeB
MNPGALPDPREVQRPIIYPYRSRCSRHLFLRVHDAVAARAFLRGMLKDRCIVDASMSDADVASMPVAVNIGFTYSGLEALALPKAYRRVLEEKAKAFVEGPSLRAARRLADTGPSAAQWWESAFHHRRIHLYVVAHGDDPKVLESSTDTLLGGPNGLTLFAAIDGAHFEDTDPDYRKVHFGFRDNVANPTIQDWPRREHDPFRPNSEHAPGEFVLGYRTNNKDNPWLLISPTPNSAPWLLPRAAIEPQFFWNGSFGVLRKMEQDVPAFERSVAGWASGLDLPAEMSTEERRAYVRAKICGRWDDGQVVRQGEYTPPKTRGGDLDDFDFTKDEKGEGCPFGSHIRRMNPRGDKIVPKRKRPLIRRGMPYGGAYEKPDGEERGLLGLFFCASLEDQFEHLLCEWGDANPMGPPNRGTAKDPFTGASGGRSLFDIPVPGRKSCELDDFTSFVTTRGTVYAFFPSLTGIGILSRERELAGERAA